ncbi:chromate transporter [Oceanobacillus zhaokaii]|uniref:Chromate transporter n=1 Tax=Oceanobacillus zhaokaii TaxID=2052660 RepID=A0A345PE46_9BACI|nr:chromate transporter [Oceanobacillus zhaokaii]AXI08276.1 chromate transporter [Oceanobacillus zhaokaii]
MRLQWNLFLAFFRVGMLGYGGGPSSIPLIHIETVEKYKWVSDEEFGDILALCNTLPGPIITKMAGYIGYRESGFLGMINAVISSILPTIFLMIILLSSLSSVKSFEWVSGMTAAVIPVVGVMLAVLTWQFLEKSGKDLGWKKTIIMSAIILVILELGIHPGIIIGVLLILALIQKDKRSSSEKKQKARAGDEQ